MGATQGDSRGRYLIVSPCRNEAAYLARTLESVASQTVPPDLWIVVDDGSTDDTLRILQEYEQRLPFLRIVQRKDRGRRAVGPGVIEAFYEGLDSVDLSRYTYLCKLDMDLELPERYFETLIERMEADPALGTCSGKPWFDHPVTGILTPENCGDEMSVGASKFYRVDCFRDIGGFVRQVMWDGIDCHRARMLGWKAQAFNDEALRFLHLRPMGSSDRGILRGRVRSGFGNYFMGTSPLYLLAIVAYRLFRHPVLTGSLATLWGYIWSALKRLPRYDDPEFRRFLRRYQHLSLVVGKRRAIEKLSAEIRIRPRLVGAPARVRPAVGPVASKEVAGGVPDGPGAPALSLSLTGREQRPKRLQRKRLQERRLRA